MSSDTALFERDQRRHTLAGIAWTVLIISLALGLYDVQFETWLSVLALLGLGLACIPVLILIRRGHWRLSAVLLSLIVLAAIGLNLYDGDGVHDSGIVALPIFIITGTLMFGKRTAPYFALAAIAVVSAVVLLEAAGYVQPTLRPATLSILVPIILLLGAASAVTWIIIDVVERNLQRARESENDARRSYDQTLEAWARILEYRDRETQGHTERVTWMAEQLARRMGMMGQSLVDVRRGAMLHDIGKLAVPDSVLLKAGKLTESEWTVIKRHPSHARDVLAPIHYLGDAVDIPWAHHEHWDGSGYPRGLRGEEIPLSARIFTVVDVWDALISDRPYRAAMDASAALEHIRAMAGTQFDPAVVAAFEGLRAQSADALR